MRDWLEDIDRTLFLLINSHHTPFLDSLMWAVSHKLVWIPLYLLIAFFAQRKWGWKGLLFFAAGAGISVALADQTSVKLFKDVFERYRPCHNRQLRDVVHLLNDHCGGMYGFVSSHAANHFALATFFSLTLFANIKKWIAAMIFWAVLICYSRVYAGVHYPADVAVGGLLGAVIGLLMARLFNFMEQKYA
jgi:undecaprenyl-diphosphatase